MKQQFRPRTPQEQQVYQTRMKQELDKVTMSWDNDLKRWHSTALKALDFASAKSLNIDQSKFIELFEVTTHGVNMNTAMFLNNNCEMRTAFEMNLTGRDWAEFLKLNEAIAQRWNKLMQPVMERVLREMEIVSGKPRLVLAGEA
jgi:L-rhamnose mutarotase